MNVLQVNTTQGMITVEDFVQQYQSFLTNHSENYAFAFFCRTITDNNRKCVLDFLKRVVDHPNFLITPELCQYTDNLSHFSYTWGFDQIHPFAFLVAEYQDWKLLQQLPNTMFQKDIASSFYFLTHPNNSVFEHYISHCSIDSFMEQNLAYHTCIELFSALKQTDTLERFIQHWTTFTPNSVQSLFHTPSICSSELEPLFGNTSFIQWLETNNNVQALSRGLFSSFERIKPLLLSPFLDNNLALKEYLFLPTWIKNTHSLTPFTVKQQFDLFQKTFLNWEQQKSVLCKYIAALKDHYFDRSGLECNDLNLHEKFFQFFTIEQLKNFYQQPEGTLPHPYDYRPFLNHSLFETVRTHIALEEAIHSLHLDTQDTTEKRKI